MFNVLDPQLARCGSITFETLYQSSLPSALKILAAEVPFLSNLSLTCTIHDLDDDKSVIQIPQEKYKLHQEVESRLHTLSVTGIGFMELCQSLLWRCGISYSTTMKHLDVCHLKILPDDVAGGTRSWRYFLHGIKVDELDTLSLSEIALEHQPLPALATKHRELSVVKHYSFDAVSEAFITAFLKDIRITDVVERISFRNCIIPRIEVTPEDRNPEVRRIDIDCADMPFTLSPFKPATIQAPCPSGDSIYNILAEFNVHALYLTNCIGVTDDLFSRLNQVDQSRSGYWDCPSWRMHTLHIRDCPRFTSGALCSHLDNRQQSWANHLQNLQVTGTCPLLAEVDADWLLAKSTMVHLLWEVQGNDRAAEIFLMTFECTGAGSKKSMPYGWTLE